MAAPVISSPFVAANQGVRPLRGQFKPFSVDVTLIATSDGAANVLVAALAAHTIFVTRIDIAVTTDNAATLTFQDSASTPIVIAKTKASPGLGPINFVFGEDGTALTEAKSLDLNISAAGLAGRIHVEGYIRATSARAA